MRASCSFTQVREGKETRKKKVEEALRVNSSQVLHMELGQRYSVMIKLDQKPADYFLRFATHPSGDMQQVLEGRAIISYTVGARNPEAPVLIQRMPKA